MSGEDAGGGAGAEASCAVWTALAGLVGADLGSELAGVTVGAGGVECGLHSLPGGGPGQLDPRAGRGDKICEAIGFGW
ncbi:hypothetical protein [Frankia sp. AiPa1]|uniref:hypothetical protein n=1 Tax=Frankia sp. AiPa1 TaxID=573492 RepID=UPI00202ADB98|nr:hypothetical protein [Frankia sp. AiPa1]MCL9758655.1 hypothetical protein [Frankia sp. AiPa1]